MRKRLSGLLVVLASLAILLALLSGYTQRAAINSRQFANRATVAVRSPSVEQLIADRVTGIVLSRASFLTALRPLIHAAVVRGVSSEGFTDSFRAAVRVAQQGIVTGDAGRLTLTLGQTGAILAAQLDGTHPALAAQLRGLDTGPLQLVNTRINPSLQKAARVAHRISTLAWLSALLALVFVIGALLVSPDRRRTLSRLGLGAALGGLVTVIIFFAGRVIVQDQFSGHADRAAAAAVYNAFMVGLRNSGIVLAAVGAIIAVAAGVRLSGRRQRLGGAGAGIIVLGVSVVFLGAGGVTAAAPSPGPCDGSPVLCQRPLNDVALAATHNSMSSPVPGWFASEQDHPIPQQLKDGIRGLLIDTYYADRLPGGRLRTDEATFQRFRSMAKEQGIPPQLIRRAELEHARLEQAPGGTRGLYLCHGFCELGGISLPSVLAQIDDFLLANPQQVLVVVNEDYVKPLDFVRAVDRSGLGKLVYRGSVTGTWPTMQQMIDRHQRIVFLAENQAGGAPWYRLAFKHAIQDTPFTFRRATLLTGPLHRADSCAVKRGPRNAPLFLVNHWISTAPLPLPSNARRVNAYGPLLARLRECERLRGQIPNLVAVDFYAQGDVFKAVAALNGLG